jgi:hypothetical protein
MLLAFRDKDEKIQQQALQITKEIVRDTIPKLPSEILSLDVIEKKGNTGDPLKSIPSGVVSVKRKDDGKEVYDMNKKADADAFEKKYGAKLEDLLPAPPTPPSPPTPPAKKKSNGPQNDVGDDNAMVDESGSVLTMIVPVKPVNVIPAETLTPLSIKEKESSVVVSFVPATPVVPPSVTVPANKKAND